jgi:hypothetical protein
MAIDRLLRANRAVVVIPVVDGLDGRPAYVTTLGELVDFEAPISSMLEAWRNVQTTIPGISAHGGNPSAAILDDMDLGLAASDTDTELTIVSKGNESTPTFKNVDATLTGLRDKVKSDTGAFNLFTQLFVGADARYALIDRIGSTVDTPFTAGDIISAFEVVTDVPVDQKADRGNLKLQAAPTPSGAVVSNYVLPA